MRLDRAGHRERQQVRGHLRPLAGVGRGRRGHAAVRDAALQRRIDFRERDRHRRRAERLDQLRHRRRERAHAQRLEIVERLDRLVAEEHLRAERPDRQHLCAEALGDALVEDLAIGIHRRLQVVHVGGDADQVDAFEERIVARREADLRGDDVVGAAAHEPQRIGEIEPERHELRAVGAQAGARAGDALHRGHLERILRLHRWRSGSASAPGSARARLCARDQPQAATVATTENQHVSPLLPSRTSLLSATSPRQAVRGEREKQHRAAAQSANIRSNIHAAGGVHALRLCIGSMSDKEARCASSSSTPTPPTS